MHACLPLWGLGKSYSGQTFWSTKMHCAQFFFALKVAHNRLFQHLGPEGGNNMHAWAMTLCVVLSAFVLVDAGVAKQLGGMPRVARNRPSSHRHVGARSASHTCIRSRTAFNCALSPGLSALVGVPCAHHHKSDLLMKSAHGASTSAGSPGENTCRPHFTSRCKRG